MSRIVLVLPGGSFGPFAPQLFLPAYAAIRRGAEVVAVEWDLGSADSPAALERKVVSPLADADLVIGKSLGSRAAMLVAVRRIPAIWVTPLLTEPAVVAGLSAAPAPILLAGGTADLYWDGQTARAQTPHVIELEGADHGLFVPGPLAASAVNLGRLATATEAFLDDVVWPR